MNTTTLNMTTLDGGVIIKKGGGGGSTPPSGGDENLIYVKLPEDKSGILFGELAGAKYIKLVVKGSYIVTAITNIPTAFLLGDVMTSLSDLSSIVACAIDPNMLFFAKLNIEGMDEMRFNSMQEGLALLGQSELPALAWERITKEEFYNLD